MLFANSELLFEIIRAAHDPEPQQAARYPAASTLPARKRPESGPTDPAAFILRLTAFVRRTIAALPTVAHVNQAAPAPCCPEPCC